MKEPKTKRFDGKLYALRHYGHILRYIRKLRAHYTALGYRVELVREKSIYQLWIRSGTDPESAGVMPARIPISNKIGRDEKIIFLGML
jgi:hypothetical protein